ncbi:MAG: methyltransferase [Bacteroidetes bacterium]|nr:methyltransferase [Bacteroidota bacterium]
MSNAIFAFKQFKVRQDKCPMKISTDSVLIGAWVNPKGKNTILDIGTGTGILALMLAQRSSAMIDAIDICAEGCKQAAENFSNSTWSNKLTIQCTPLQEFFPKKKYDLIISNPPFFPCPKAHKEKDGAQARFNHKLSFAELADGVVRLLSPKGSFHVILPVHEGTSFTNEAEKRKLFLTDYVWVKTTARKKFPKRILMKFEFSQKQMNDDKILVIQSDNEYTKEYKELTKEYYLKF